MPEGLITVGATGSIVVSAALFFLYAVYLSLDRMTAIAATGATIMVFAALQLALGVNIVQFALSPGTLYAAVGLLFIYAARHIIMLKLREQGTRDIPLPRQLYAFFMAAFAAPDPRKDAAQEYQRLRKGQELQDVF